MSTAGRHLPSDVYRLVKANRPDRLSRLVYQLNSVTAGQMAVQHGIGCHYPNLFNRVRSGRVVVSKLHAFRSIQSHVLALRRNARFPPKLAVEQCQLSTHSCRCRNAAIDA